MTDSRGFISQHGNEDGHSIENASAEDPSSEESRYGERAFNEPPVETRNSFMSECLRLAQNAPALPTNFRVGAMLMDRTNDCCLAQGYTNELPGNTHAEQVCLMKITAVAGGTDGADTGRMGEAVRLMNEGRVVLYTTVEPCVKRLSGQKSCVERILDTQRQGKGIQTVYVGVSEPNTFVTGNSGRAILERAGIKVVHVSGLEENILHVATAGHQMSETSSS